MTKVTYGMRSNLAERRFAGHGSVQGLFLFLAICVAIIALSAVGFTQELAATLTGTVTDPSGALVAGATVVVHSNDAGTDDRTVTTNGSGGFNITNLPAGRYTVTVKNAGFETSVANDVVLDVAEKHTLDVALKTGQASATVEVTAENTAIQTTTAEESGTVTGDQVRELALSNRNFEQLVLLQPGVSNQLGDKPGFGLSSNTQISINGARTGANNWTVDGADINDSGSNGTLLNTPGIDAIQEFTLERSNYDASFGRSGGGQIVVATSLEPINSMAARSNSTATTFTTQTRLGIGRASPLAEHPAHSEPRLSAITITDSRSAVLYSFPRFIIRARTEPSSSGRRSGERQALRERTKSRFQQPRSWPELLPGRFQLPQRDA